MRSVTPRPERDEPPDARDGLTRKERVVLWVLAGLQAERGDGHVPLVLLYGRVIEHVDMGVEELKKIATRLCGRAVSTSPSSSDRSTRPRSSR